MLRMGCRDEDNYAMMVGDGIAMAALRMLIFD